MQTLQPFDLPLLLLSDSLQELWCVTMTFPTRWQDCEAFIEALLQRKYVTRDADGNVGPLMADGIYLYMYELWCDGRLVEREGVRDWLVDQGSADLAIEVEQGSHLPSASK